MPTKTEQFTFWDCVTLKSGCYEFLKNDSRTSFIILVASFFYLLFLFLILADLRYWWSLEKAQQQIFYYVDSMRGKLNRVEAERNQLQKTRLAVDEGIQENRSFARLLQTIRTMHVNPNEEQEQGNYSVVTLIGNESEKEIWIPEKTTGDSFVPDYDDDEDVNSTY